VVMVDLEPLEVATILERYFFIIDKISQIFLNHQLIMAAHRDLRQYLKSELQSSIRNRSMFRSMTYSKSFMGVLWDRNRDLKGD
jgi:hypothetical protein